MSDSLPPLPGAPSTPPYGTVPPVSGTVGATDEPTSETAPVRRLRRSAGWRPTLPADGTGGSSPEPRVIVASGVLLAGMAVVLAVLVGMVSDPVGVGTGPAGFFERVQAASTSVGLPAVLLVPLSLLLRPSRREGAGGEASRGLAVGAAGLGGALTFLALLALLADLVGGAVVAPNRMSAVLLDLAVLGVAACGTWWAFAEVQDEGPRGPVDGSTLIAAPDQPAGRVDWRPADPGWAARPPVWPEQPPTAGRERGRPDDRSW